VKARDEQVRENWQITMLALSSRKEVVIEVYGRGIFFS